MWFTQKIIIVKNKLAYRPENGVSTPGPPGPPGSPVSNRCMRITMQFSHTYQLVMKTPVVGRFEDLNSHSGMVRNVKVQ